MTALAGLLGIALVLEGGRVELEADAPLAARGDGLARVVEDAELEARARAADRARLAQPFLRADLDAAAFGAPVELVEDGAPPLDHRPLDLDRDRRRAVADEGERREVVAAADFGRQAQQPDEMRRDQEGRGRAVALDGLEKGLRLELLHQDEIGAEQQRAVAVGVGAGVVEGRRDEVDAVAGAFGQEGRHHGGAGEGRDRRRRARRRVLAQDAFRAAGRARGVEHVLAAEGLLVGRAGEGFDGGPGDEAREARGARVADDEAARRVDRLQGLASEVCITSIDDEGVGLAVLDDVGDVGSGPAGRAGGEATPRPGRAAIGGDVLGRVRHQDRDGAPGRNVRRVEGPGEAGGGGDRVGVAEEMDRDRHHRPG